MNNYFFACLFLYRLKNSLQTARLDLYVNGEILCPSDDKRLISQVPLRDRTVSVGLVFHLMMNFQSTVLLLLLLLLLSLLLLFGYKLNGPYLISIETVIPCCTGHSLNLTSKLLRSNFQILEVERLQGNILHEFIPSLLVILLDLLWYS